MALGDPLRRSAVAALIVAASALIGASAAAGAASTWTKPVTLGPTDREASPPRIALAPDGEAIAVWQGNRPKGIEVSSRRPGGRWTPPVSLTTSRVAAEPQLAATARKAVVVWSDAVRGDGTGIIAATRLGGGRWGRPRDISLPRRRGERTEASEPQVAITRRGEAVAIWTAGDERHRTDSFIGSATQSATRTAWAAPIGIPYSIEGEAPQVGAAPGGEAVAIWGANYDEETGIEVASLSPQGKWSFVKRLAHPGGFPAPQLAITSRGEAIGAWVSGSEGEGKGIQVATRSPGSRWKVRSLAPREEAYDPKIVTAPGGRATVVWVRYAGSEPEVVTSTHRPGGRWSAPVSLAAEGLQLPRDAQPEIAVTDGGESIAAWASGGESGERGAIQTSSKPRGQPWSSPTDISTSPPAPMFGAADIQIAVAPSGEAFALWRSYDGTGWVIRASTRPAAGSS